MADILLLLQTFYTEKYTDSLIFLAFIQKRRLKGMGYFFLGNQSPIHAVKFHLSDDRLHTYIHDHINFGMFWLPTMLHDNTRPHTGNKFQSYLQYCGPDDS